MDQNNELRTPNFECRKVG